MTEVGLWTAEAQAALYRQIGYRTGHPQQDAFLFDWTHRYQVVVCPRRSSKSFTAAKKALPILLGREALPDGSGPRPTRVWIVGPTYDLASKEFQYVWNDYFDLVKAGHVDRPPIARNDQAGKMLLVTAHGSILRALSADKPQSLQGEAVDFVLLAEAAQLPREVWERYVLATLATSQGIAVFPTTPDSAARWLYELWLRGLQGDPLVASYTWPITGNPVFDPEELERMRAFYGESHPAFREQFLGEWTFYAGRVFGQDFSLERNLIAPYEIPADWRRVRTIDFGFRDPFVCLWAALTPDGALDVYREYYTAGRPLAVHAEALRAHPEPIYYSIADSSEPQAIADLRRYGVPALGANRDRREGRARMADALRTGRLRFFKGACPETIRELAEYRWDKDADREGVKEKTVGDDHAMDALRYLCLQHWPQERRAVVTPPADSFAAEMRRRQTARERTWWPTMQPIV